MKKIFTLGLGILMLAACSSDDNGGSTINSSNLTNKKWVAVSFVVFGVTIPVDVDYPDCPRDFVMFKPAGVFASTYHNASCEEFVDNGTWIMEGNTITTNEDGDITVAVVKKLTATQLEVTTQEDYNLDGQMETVTLIMTSN